MKKVLLCTGFLLSSMIYGESAARNFAPLSKGEPLPEYVATTLPSSGQLKFNPVIPASSITAGKQKSLRMPLSSDVSRAEGLRGQVVYAASWPSVNAPTGIYSVPVTNDGEFNLIASAPLFGGQGVDNGQGIFYGTHTYTSFGMTFVEIIAYDTDTWEQIGKPEASNYKMIATAVALDPSSLKIYGSYYSAEQNIFEWGEADYDNGERTSIATFTIDKRPIALGATRSGQFYAVNASGEFGTIDKSTGAFTFISDTGLACDDWVSGCVDDTAGKFIFHYHGPQEASLYDIDLQTGEVSKLCDFNDGQQVLCLNIPLPAAADKAPAIPEFSVSGIGGEMKAGYSIHMPSTLFDGTPSDESFTYSVTVDGVEKATGTGNASATVTGSIDIADRGKHKFVCTVSNNVGKSPKAKTEAFIGYGTPSAPENVILACQNNKLQLSWSPVTTCSDEGYINPQEIRYNIYEGENLVETGLEDCSYSKTIESDEGYQSFSFSVQAINGDRKSPLVLSNNLGIGGLLPPYSEDFSGSNHGFVFLDSNNDKRTWSDYTLDSNGLIRYSSGWSGSADDWAFTPGIILEAGKSYDFSFKTWCQNSWTSEELEVRLGTGLTVQDMAVPLMEKTRIKGFDKANPKEVTATIVVKETAVYHIGFHITTYSDDGLNCYLDDINISGGQDAPVPDEVEEINIIASPTGEPKAEISFRIPSKWLSGEPVDDEVTVKVERDNVEIGTYKGNNGEIISLSDQVERSGNYIYRFTPSNFNGKPGKVSEVTAYIGAKAPAVVSEASISETSVPGKVTVTWSPVTVDCEGNPLEQANVSYMLYTLDNQSSALHAVLESPVKTTSVELTALDNPEHQDLVYYYISAFNRDVESQQLRRTPIITVGNPYSLPLQMGFNPGMLDELFMGNENTNNGTWGIYTEEMFQDVKSQDGDGSFAACYGRYVGNSADLFTGKIDLADAQNPCITFYMYCFGGEDLNEITVSVLSDGQKTPLKICSNTDIEETGWKKMTVSLKAFKGKTVQIYFTGKTVSNKFTFLDNVKIFDMAARDISVGEIKAVEEVLPSAPFEITAVVTNSGASTLSDIRINLIADGEIADTFLPSILSPDNSVKAVFNQQFSVLETGSHTYRIEAIVEGDGNPSDNISSEITVVRAISNLPGVTGLGGSSHEFGSVISWNPVEPSADETHLGYNVYCDNTKLNVYPLTTPIFIDTDVQENLSKTYHVTALYSEGESELSEPFSFTYSDAETISEDLQQAIDINGLTVTVNLPSSVVSTLMTTDGKIVAIINGTGSFTAPVSGIYLLRTLNGSAKIVLR